MSDHQGVTMSYYSLSLMVTPYYSWSVSITLGHLLAPGYHWCSPATTGHY